MMCCDPSSTRYVDVQHPRGCGRGRRSSNSRRSLGGYKIEGRFFFLCATSTNVIQVVTALDPSLALHRHTGGRSGARTSAGADREFVQTPASPQARIGAILASAGREAATSLEPSAARGERKASRRTTTPERGFGGPAE